MNEPEWVELAGREAAARWGSIQEGDEYWSKLHHKWKPTGIAPGHNFNTNFRYRRRVQPQPTELEHFI